jgi:SNF2 family DNA or RNA helicase
MDISSCANRLQILKQGNLNESSIKYNQCINNFKGELKEHQKNMLHAMRNLEDNGYQDNDDFYSVHTTIGICGDKTGAGKSITVLALISDNPEFKAKEKVIQQFGTFVYVKSKVINSFVKSNLIVVPHSCFSQWLNYINKFTTLSFYTISKRKEIENFNISKLKEQNGIVLCTSSMYNEFMMSHEVTWSRVFFDEADSINIPAVLTPSANFVWFISSSLQNLLFPSGIFFEQCKLPNSHRTIITKKYIDGIKRNGYIRDTFRALERYDADIVISKLVLKNNDDYVKQSFDLPEYNKNIILCRTPSYLKMLLGVVNDDVIKLLNAGNIGGAIDKIGCNIDTHENIIISVTETLQNQLNNTKREIEYQKSLQYSRESYIENRNKKIESLEKNVKDTEHKIQCIKDRVNSYKDDMCTICMDIHTNPTVLTPCQHIFCFSCITRCLQIKSACPTCRCGIRHEDLHVIGNKKIMKKDDLPNKENALQNIISNNKSGKFLIFSSHDQSFAFIENALKEIDQEFVRVMGSVHRINNLITNYREKNLNVLMLNTQHYGTGLNLENTTDIIFYHKMSVDMENQVIGRAQRIGRKIPLNVHYLYQENEME